MKRIVRLCAAAAFASTSFAVTAHAGEPAPAGAGFPVAYEPMAPFAPFAGKTWRGEGKGPDGAPIVDVAEWAFILGGRALQSTHRLEDGSYGGRTIFFYDEGAKTYVFHYFTTAGFHTHGSATLTEDGFEASETVDGHETIKEVRSRMKVVGDELHVSSTYVGKDGAQSPGHGFVYREVIAAAPVFPEDLGR